jgi:hypothetical protein
MPSENTPTPADDTHTVNGMMETIRRLEGALTACRRPIPVSESLPPLIDDDYSERVLVFSGDWAVAWLANYNEDEPPYWVLEDGMGCKPPVTHWMPLPPHP